MPQVRLIGADGEQIGVVPIAQALIAAQEAKLDLVEIAPQASPVVCKILDYGKHVFEAKKDKAAAKKKESAKTHKTATQISLKLTPYIRCS